MGDATLRELYCLRHGSDRAPGRLRRGRRERRSEPEPPPATPTPRVSLTLSSDRQLLTVGQLGLRYTPDEHTSLVQQPGGAYWVWIAASVNRQHGSAALLSTTDETTFAPVVGSGGVASPVFGPPSPSQGDTFDNYYAAPGSVLSIGGGYIMIFHGEDHTWNGQTYPYPFYATVGLATSPDGIHWTTVGLLKVAIPSSVLRARVSRIRVTTTNIKPVKAAAPEPTIT